MFYNILSTITNAAFIILVLHSQAVSAMSPSPQILTLNCQNRGYVDIIFHLYGHVQEKWAENFEVGSRYNNADGYEIASFTNGDILFHNLLTNTFIYHYFDNDSVLFSCEKIYQSATHPVAPGDIRALRP